MNQTTFLTRFALIATLATFAVGFAGASCEKTPPPPKVVEQPHAPVSTPQNKTKVPNAVGPDAPALMIISGLKGYTEPCGCTLDIMLGGIDRIVKYVDDAQKLYPAFGLVDAGDLFFEDTNISEHEITQEKARVDLIVESIKRLPLEVTVPGERDFALGVDFYLETIKRTQLKPLGANITIQGEHLPASKTLKLGPTQVLLIGAADGANYTKIDGIEVTEPDPEIAAALKGVSDETVVVLLGQGELGWVKKRLAANPRIDFGVVGRDPRETDQADAVGDAFTLEPYDQGRYLGILKLNRVRAGRLSNARAGGKSELETIERQIKHVNESISSLPPASKGEEPPILANLRKRLTTLEARRTKIANAALKTPADANWFIWSTVPMEPEYALDPKIKGARLSYNKSLKAIAAAADRAIVPPKEGEAFFVGTDQCAACHTEELGVWKKTAHADAYATLVERDKDFDLACVGCHVVGYEQPGGSVVGKVQYPASLTGAQPKSWEKDLRNVGCESCHGPGSQHIIKPTNTTGKPQNITRKATQITCQQCHVPEHSPRFDFETYVKKITGPGHMRERGK